jgi:murein DD-endopeptidase MepM/ murein hydrolase activator NlpD
MAVGVAVYAAGSRTPASVQAGEARAAEGLTYSGSSAFGSSGGGQSLPLSALPFTVSAPPVQPQVSSSLLASEADLRLEAARAADGGPLPPAAPASAIPSPTPSPTATPSAPVCDKSISNLYCVYTVQSGDTLSKIAAAFGLKGTAGLASWELLVQSNKPDITSAEDVIQAGQKLRIPLKNGIVHLVLTGETLGELADDYGVTTAALVAAGNNVPSSGELTIGQEILIPDPAHLPPVKPAPAVPPPIPTATASETPEATETPEPTGTPAAASPVTTGTARATPTRTPTPAAARPSRAGFIWPATGPISSYFGPSHPLGIDIDLFANPNAPIVAAAAGRVTFAGGDTCCSYGLYVIIDHGNGYSTLYAHLSQINVTVGQTVAQGQLIGRGGRTGYATGNHLHFEVRLNGAVIDPLSVLP